MPEGPEPDVGQEGEDNQTETIGMDEMLYASQSTLENAEDKNILAKEYHLKLVTDNFQYQFGGTPGAKDIVTSDDTAMLVKKLKETFEAVETGSFNEDDYFFELLTPNFYYTSGNYHPSEQAETTLMALLQTFQSESGNIRLQENNVSRVEALIVILEVPPIPDSGEAPTPPGIRESNKATRFKLKFLRQTKQIRRKLLCAFGTRLVGWKWTNNLMIQFSVVFCVQVLLVGALPVNVEPDSPLTLTAGSDGVISFACTNEQQSARKYYTVKFEEKDRPFYVDGTFDLEGLMSPDQAERFRVEYSEEGSAMSVEINIASVSLEDQGTYIVILIIHGETPEYHFMKRLVLILIPPGPAVCFLMPSETMMKMFEVHCHSRPGNGDSTLTCFQKGQKIPYLQNTGTTSILRSEGLVRRKKNNGQIVHRRSFWLMDIDIPVSCCSHDIAEMGTITQTSCDQYIYPRIEPANSPISPVDKIPTKMVPPTIPLFAEEEKKQPSLEIAPYSGCGRNADWPAVILPLMVVFTYMCISNP